MGEAWVSQKSDRILACLGTPLVLPLVVACPARCFLKLFPAPASKAAMSLTLRAGKEIKESYFCRLHRAIVADLPADHALTRRTPIVKAGVVEDSQLAVPPGAGGVPISQPVSAAKPSHRFSPRKRTVCLFTPDCVLPAALP